MRNIIYLAALLFLTMLSACSSTHQTTSIPQDPLFATISALDTAVFNSFNNCSSSAQLEKYSSYFSPEVEFYHDSGGVTWTRDAMILNTQKYVCGKFQRELVPGSLKVFPIKDFGAISEGEHRFCQFGKSHCDGIAKFTLIWRYRDNKWEITRALSYGHRANK